MRRKILMGVLAVALPVGTLAATQTVASAGAPDNPVLCTGFASTVTFGTPLTTAGVPTSAKLGANTGVGGAAFSCSGHASSSPVLSISGGKNAKLLKTDPAYNKTLGIKYVTGTWNEFAAAGGGLKKSLKTITFTVGGVSTLFKAKSSSIVVGGIGTADPATSGCPGEVGFRITGQVKGTYSLKVANVLACLGTDAGGTSTGNFGADYLSAQGVTSATIDGAESMASL